MKTIGVAITHKLIKCQDKLVKFDLFDLSGSEEVIQVRKSIIRLLLVYIIIAMRFCCALI